MFDLAAQTIDDLSTGKQLNMRYWFQIFFCIALRNSA